MKIQKLEIKVVDEHLQFVNEFKRSLDTFRSQPLQICGSEGADLSHINIEKQSLMEWLTNYYHKNRLDKSKVVIETGNLIQDRSVWPNIKSAYCTDQFLAYQGVNTKDKEIKKKFGMFIGSDRWHRFLLAKYMFENHKDECYQTYWYDGNWGFNRKLYQYLDHEEINNFKRHIPMYIETKGDRRHANGYIDWTDTNPLLPFYDHIAVDVVCETWHRGDTFSPNEKMGRPLATKTGFVVYAARNFLVNLRRLGFKTFESVWNESYDKLEGIERIEAIKKLIKQLSERDPKEILDKIKHIVEHNKAVYDKISRQHILDTFNQ